MAAAAIRNFNTLKSFERLKKVGVPEDQAREMVGMVEESINANMENLVTKADLKLEIQELRTELKSELRAELEPIKTDIAILKAGMAFMQRLFFGSTLIILLVGLYFRQ